MNIFKILLGIIIATLGLGMTAAGWAIANGGQWSTTVNILLGITVAFIGLSFLGSGGMLIMGGTVRDALGGAVSALQGHGGIGLRPGGAYYPYQRNKIKRVLYNILLYIFLAIAITIISVFSVGRVINLPL